MYLAILVASFALVYYLVSYLEGGTVIRFSIYSNSVLLYIGIMVLIGLTLVLQYDVENYALKRSTYRAQSMAFWSALYAFLVIPITGAILRYKKVNLLSYKRREIRAKVDSDFGISRSKIGFYLGLTVVVVIAMLYSISRLNNHPGLLLLSGDISGYRLSRSIAKFSFNGNGYIKNLLFENIAPVLFFVSYGYYSKNKSNFVIRLWKNTSLALALLAVTFTGEKAPIVIFIIQFILLRSLLGKKLSNNVRLILVVFLSFFVIYIYWLSSGSLSFSLYGGVLSRILMVPSSGLALTFDVFPTVHPYLNGASFPGWLVGLFGMDSVRSAKILMQEVNPAGVANGTAGVINSLFVAEAYANFGIIGLLLAPIYVGIFIYYIHRLLHLGIKTPEKIAFLVYITFALPILGGFVGFIWNVNWMWLYFVFFVLRRSFK